MLRQLMLVLTLLVPTQALAAMECDTTPETKIIDTINEDPSKLVRVLKDSDLSAFLSNMANRGYLSGALGRVDVIYIVDAGKLPGYTSDNVWIFFVDQGCLIKAIPASKPVILEMLP